ncbi:MAG TPA: uroporphyrinogen-III C-methyltransferase [Thermoanaerobaculia bacterium]|nr:uroporphyrinogen-III C-methyltransferase [Thermoanaerobaculia bacterium]
MSACSEQRRPGLVSLVGAGPGDPELVTVRGLRRLERADAVLYDRLVHPALLQEAPPHAELVYVGKAPGRAELSQEEIGHELVRRGRRGERVVRLKGGDPFVFGRGFEEAIACARAGVPCEVVPGLTSAVAGPAAAGIPLTHRGLAASFAVITGHAADGSSSESVDWRGFAGVDTLVILMGVGRLERIAADLVRAGRAPGTPVALIERATLPEQREVATTLERMAVDARAASVRAPALIVVGAAVALRDLAALHWQPSDSLDASFFADMRYPGGEPSPTPVRLEEISHG